MHNIRKVNVVRSIVLLGVLGYAWPVVEPYLVYRCEAIAKVPILRKG